MRHPLIILAAVLLLGSGTAALGQGQMPEGMKSYWNLKHGFQLRIPERWKVELLTDDKGYLVDIWEPDYQALASVGRLADVSADLGEAFARRYIAEEADWYSRQRNWSEVKLIWVDRAPFSFPLGFYGEWEIKAKDGKEYYVMIYYLRDDGTGRNLSAGRVTRATMFFLTWKRNAAQFRDTFHRMAGSMRFLKPSP